MPTTTRRQQQYMCVAHMKCNGKTFMCLFMYGRTREKRKFSFQFFFSFLFRLFCYYCKVFPSSSILQAGQMEKGLRFYSEIRRQQRKMPPNDMKYTEENLKMYVSSTSPSSSRSLSLSAQKTSCPFQNIHEFQIKTISVCYVVYDV